MRRPDRLFRGLMLLLWPLSLGAQTPEIANILARLERLERENQALTEEVRTLRAKVDAGSDVKTEAPSPDTPAHAPVSLDERVEILEQRTGELQQTKVESSQKFPIRLSGMALFNAFMNSKQNGGSDYPVVAAPTGPGRAGATVRQSIIGLDYRGPETVWGGHVHGSLYMDFFAGANNNAFRIRTGSIEIDWKSRSIMAGLEKPIINPREPSSLALVGISPLTGAGNLWLWLPQVRVQQDLHFATNTGLRAQLGAIQTREVSPYPGSTFTGPLEASRPGLEGRFEFFHRFDDERRIEIAPGFHTSQTHVAGQSVASQIFSTDWFFNPHRRVELTGFFYKGQNVAPLGNGIQQGYMIYYHGRFDEVEPVHSIGGWAQVTIHAARRIDLHGFSGVQNDRDRDLTTGRIGKNFLYGGNLYYRIAPNVLVGLEATQVRTTYIGQGLRINNHYDLALAYLF